MTSSAAPPLHPDLAPLAFLLGTWSGTGAGEYPTIDPFTYREQTTFAHVGKPFLTYLQRTWSPAGAPMHTESGYLRAAGTDRVELVVAHPTGHAELSDGSLAHATDGDVLRFRSATIGATATAKEVLALERELTVDGDVLRYELRMAAVGRPLTHHLAATLTRDS